MKRFLVLLGCFIGLAVTITATLMIPFGLYQKPITDDLGWSRTQFSTAVSLASFCNAAMLPLAGYLVDRFGPPRVIAVGVVLGGIFYAALSQASTFSFFALMACLTVMAGTLAGYPAYLSLVERWFDKRLGLALAIASAGVAIGVAGASWLITQILASHGWRQAVLTVGCAILVIGAANLLLFIRDNPGPVPEAERTQGTVESDSMGVSMADALRTADFWLLTFSFTLVMIAAVGLNFHLPALLADAGGSATQIASVVATISAGSFVGRLATGIMLDRWPVRLVATLFYVGQAVGLLILLGGLNWAVPAAFLLGMIIGAEIDLMGYTIARRFGRIAYARIFGTSYAVTLVGVAIGPVLTAQIYDRTGSYDAGLVAFPFLSMLALGLLLKARLRSPGASPKLGTEPA